jgi:predicted small secreted protein
MRFKVYFLLLLAAVFIAGCSTTQGLKTSIASITENVDSEMTSKIPADKKERFSQAEFNLKVADQKVKLAELKSELAARQKTSAGLEEDLANNFLKEAAIDYDLVKIEAIISSGLGKKEDNLKLKTKLQLKKLEIQSDRVKINADLEEVKAKSDSISAEIAKMDEAIKAMKSDSAKLSAPAKSVPGKEVITAPEKPAPVKEEITAPVKKDEATAPTANGGK